MGIRTICDTRLIYEIVLNVLEEGKVTDIEDIDDGDNII